MGTDVDIVVKEFAHDKDAAVVVVVAVIGYC